jgi:hypothetical protein
VIIVLTLMAILVWLLLPDNAARRAAERTHRALRQEGFKLDVSEFELSAPLGLGANNELLTVAGDTSRNSFSIRRLDLMRPVNSNSAMVIWTQETPVNEQMTDSFWPDLRQSITERNAVLDRVCESVLSGPFRFRTALTTNSDNASDIFRARLIASAVAARTILELHEQHLPAAWTNLLALTRLVTAWQTEPMESSHLTRSRLVTTAQRVTWEALQAKDWSDSQLATLQLEWESANFFSGLPETAALSRAGTIAFCDAQREKPAPPGPTLRQFIYDVINSPGRARDAATSGWRSARYRNYESYEDETAWLLYFRDCELDYRRALTVDSWRQLRDLPSATNSRPARASNSVLGIDALRNMAPGGYGGFQRQGMSLLARAAEAEARRRLLVAAIAIERFHRANHNYPDSLSNLVPEFLKSVPKDYMDGEVLRYRRTDDRFLLYSVGSDGQDDNGQLLAEAVPLPGGGSVIRPEGPDLVWPLRATPTEVQAYAQPAESRLIPRGFPAMSSSEQQTLRRYRISAQAVRTNTLTAPNPTPSRPGS